MNTARKPGAAAPPEPLEPSELWAALMALPRPTRAIPVPRCFPGTDTPVGEVLVWPLTQEEQMAANAAADRFTKELLKDPQKKDEANLGYIHTYQNEVAVQVLYRACRDPKNIERPAFPSPTLMRQNFSTDEIGVLFASFCTAQAELGPIRATMTKEESEALILRLVEGGSAFPFDSLSWEAQRSLVLSLASQLVACWTAMSSAGLPLDVSSYGSARLAEKRATHADDDDGEESETDTSTPEPAPPPEE